MTTQQDKIAVVVGDLGADIFRSGIATPNGLEVCNAVNTPQCPGDLFQLLYKHFVSLAVENRTPYVVVGLPGPVRSENGSISVDGSLIGPLPNIAGMSGTFNLKQRLSEIGRDVNRLTLMALNDAQAAAYAAAEDYSSDYNRSPLMYVSLGRGGIGGEVVQGYETMRLKARLLKELGHTAFRQENGSYITLEKVLSETFPKGAGITDKTLVELKNKAHQVGHILGQLLGYAIPDIGMKDIVIGGYYAQFHEQFDAVVDSEIDGIMDALPPGIATRPEVHYVPAEKDEHMGLRGCYIAVKRLFLRE